MSQIRQLDGAIPMRRHLRYFAYMMRHKWYVFRECLALRVPIWIAIWHDWDKFAPDEWFACARCFYAPEGTKHYAPDNRYLQARLRHHHRNKHHYQHWILVWESGTIEALPIPEVYRREMLADWRGAGRSLGKPDLLSWYTAERDHMVFHPETRAWLEAQLGYVPQSAPK